MEEIEKEVARGDIWEDKRKAESLLKERNRLLSVTKKWEEMQKTLEEIRLWLEMIRETGDESVLPEVEALLRKLKGEVRRFELEAVLNDPYDRNNAIMSINAGAGGTEAQDWAEMLLRMYTRWAERKGFKCEIMDMLQGEEAGIKSVTLNIKGENAYGLLKGESGVHRLVRISPFDASGRRHTSFASVSVLPEIEDNIEVDLKESDLRIETFRASGAGGQHVNKTDSAVRITHIPTGIVVTCRNERSQHRNRAIAMKILRSKLYELKRRELEEEKKKLAGEKKEIGFGSQIRSYILQPYKLVKDHRTGYETPKADEVLDGEIDPFIEAYLLSKRG